MLTGMSKFLFFTAPQIFVYVLSVQASNLSNCYKASESNPCTSAEVGIYPTPKNKNGQAIAKIEGCYTEKFQRISDIPNGPLNGKCTDPKAPIRYYLSYKTVCPNDTATCTFGGQVIVTPVMKVDGNASVDQSMFSDVTKNLTFNLADVTKSTEGVNPEDSCNFLKKVDPTYVYDPVTRTCTKPTSSLCTDLGFYWSSQYQKCLPRQNIKCSDCSDSGKYCSGYTYAKQDCFCTGTASLNDQSVNGACRWVKFDLITNPICEQGFPPEYTWVPSANRCCYNGDCSSSTPPPMCNLTCGANQRLDLNLCICYDNSLPPPPPPPPPSCTLSTASCNAIGKNFDSLTCACLDVTCGLNSTACNNLGKDFSSSTCTCVDRQCVGQWGTCLNPVNGTGTQTYTTTPAGATGCEAADGATRSCPWVDVGGGSASLSVSSGCFMQWSLNSCGPGACTVKVVGNSTTDTSGSVNAGATGKVYGPPDSYTVYVKQSVNSDLSYVSTGSVSASNWPASCTDGGSSSCSKSCKVNETLDSTNCTCNLTCTRYLNYYVNGYSYCGCNVGECAKGNESIGIHCENADGVNLGSATCH